MANRKVGILRSWNEAKAFGIIRVGGPESLERYFLHISGIRSGTGMPRAGMTVEFEVSDRPAEDGQLARAVRADINATPIQGGVA
jgi:cold shock CspA family protein